MSAFLDWQSNKTENMSQLREQIQDVTSALNRATDDYAYDSLYNLLLTLQRQYDKINTSEYE